MNFMQTFLICAQACQKSLPNFYDVLNLSVDRCILDPQIDVYLVVFLKLEGELMLFENGN